MDLTTERASEILSVAREAALEAGTMLLTHLRPTFKSPRKAALIW